MGPLKRVSPFIVCVQCPSQLLLCVAVRGTPIRDRDERDPVVRS